MAVCAMFLHLLYFISTSSVTPLHHYDQATVEERKAISCTFSQTYMLKYASKPLTVKSSVPSSFTDAHQTPLQLAYSVLAYHHFLVV